MKGGAMNNRTKEVLNGILDRFKTGDIPDAIALASYPKFQRDEGRS